MKLKGKRSGENRGVYKLPRQRLSTLPISVAFASQALIDLNRQKFSHFL
jgi:hypothetical protein